ncbi:MAG: tRNA preQ1(34) S-adenosylmethionine ribosyltransferase-isomerase QueA [Candidatus Muiribacteriota bacterium]
MKKELHLDSYDYFLPEELIAQTPSLERTKSRMLVVDRKNKKITDSTFDRLPDFIDSSYLMVMNNTRVMKARLTAIKETGAKIEIFLLEKINSDTWKALVKPLKRFGIGKIAWIDKEIKAEVIELIGDGEVLVKFSPELTFEHIEKYGDIPLPPYIKEKIENPERYQTVFSKEIGSSAAPTAGLHFDEEIFKKLEEKGIQKTFINLTIGLGTFRPLSKNNIVENNLHEEKYFISSEAAEKINKHRQSGGKILAVGTTSVRTLETNVKKYAIIKEGEDKTTHFIYPGYEFGITDAMITNFHLPKSSLLVMICAFAGYDFTMEVYNHAVKNRYRFFSFGDCMLII